MDHLPFDNPSVVLQNVEYLGEIYPSDDEDEDEDSGTGEDIRDSAPPLMSFEEIETALEEDEFDPTMNICIQEYFWFGLLRKFHKLVGVPWDKKRFIVQEGEDEYLTSRPVLQYTAPLLYKRFCEDPVYDNLPKTNFGEAMRAKLTPATVKLLAPAPPEDLVDELDVFFQKSRDEYNRLSVAFSKGRSKYGRRQGRRNRYATVLAAGLLLEHLTQVCLTFKFRPESIMNMKIEWGVFTADARNTAAAKGWCPLRTFHLGAFTSLLLFFALSPKRSEGQDHTDCTNNECMVGPDGPIMHAKDHHSISCDNQCKMLWVDVEDLARKLEAGKIPVIASPYADSNGKLELSSAEDRPQYVSISHVWAHGLGNPDKNAIRSCKLEELFGLAGETGLQNPALWLDTLSVPVGDEYKKQRRLAINDMRRVYASAPATIVVDRRLSNDVGENVYMRQAELCMSDWMYRLWTLQEMLLPGPERLFISFKDELMRADKLLKIHLRDGAFRSCFEESLARRLNERFQFNDLPDEERSLTEDTEDTALQSEIVNAFLETDPELRDILMPTAARESLVGPQRLGHTIGALSMRRTTKARDEPVCLATLLDMDLNTLPDPFDITDVYKQLGSIQLTPLFCKGPRLQKDGFRWAPATYLGQRNMFPSDEENERNAEVTEHGLQFEATTYILKDTQCDLDEGLYEGRWAMQWRSEVFTLSLKSYEADAEFDLSTEFGLILQDAELSEDGDITTVVLVQQQHRDPPEENDGVRFGQYLAFGYLIRGVPGHVHWNDEDPFRDLEVPVLDVLDVTDVTWCIG